MEFLKHHRKIISSYNKRKHSGLKNKTPQYVHFLQDRRKINSITKDILNVKTKNMFDKRKSVKKKGINTSARLKVGSHVRLLLATVTQSKFARGYKQQNTQEIFRIHSIIDTSPITYRLKDLSGETVKGTFYKQELVEVAKPEFFLINSIIKSKKVGNKKQYLVSWVGYDDSFNSWIGGEDIYDFKKLILKKMGLKRCHWLDITVTLYYF